MLMLLLVLVVVVGGGGGGLNCVLQGSPPSPAAPVSHHGITTTSQRTWPAMLAATMRR
jgi:hypothetical protein